MNETNPDIVFIGMGETCIRVNNMPGDGVYRSTDAPEFGAPATPGERARTQARSGPVVLLPGLYLAAARRGATFGANSWLQPPGFIIVDSKQIVGNRLEIREVTGSFGLSCDV